MNKLDDLKQEFEVLNQTFKDATVKLEVLKQQLEQLKLKRWALKFGDEYWFISDTGGIINSIWIDCTAEKNHLSLNNIFRTEEEAEFELERRKVFAELELLADGKCDDGGWYYYIRLFGKGVSTAASYTKEAPYTFSSKQLAQQAIDEITPERLKKFYFGVVEQMKEYMVRGYDYDDEELIIYIEANSQLEAIKECEDEFGYGIVEVKEVSDEKSN